MTTNKEDIRRWLDLYMEGKTSLEEEALLTEYFRSPDADKDFGDAFGVRENRFTRRERAAAVERLHKALRKFGISDRTILRRFHVGYLLVCFLLFVLLLQSFEEISRLLRPDEFSSEYSYSKKGVAGKRHTQSFRSHLLTESFLSPKSAAECQPVRWGALVAAARWIPDPGGRQIKKNFGTARFRDLCRMDWCTFHPRRRCSCDLLSSKPKSRLT